MCLQVPTSTRGHGNIIRPSNFREIMCLVMLACFSARPAHAWARIGSLILARDDKGSATLGAALHRESVQDRLLGLLDLVQGILGDVVVRAVGFITTPRLQEFEAVLDATMGCPDSGRRSILSAFSPFPRALRVLTLILAFSLVSASPVTARCSRAGASW